ncbi:MAG: hypothetical protein JKX83_00480 [Pseudomonadales bacterium]|nr:hypothetical protein [Pseudomonadales bacterium]
MDRRNFIQLLGFGAGATVFSSALVGCSSEPQTELYGWAGPESTLEDIRLKVISYAILAPNPHNKQPWIVKLIDPLSFDLYVDPDRLLPATDPYHRQIHIGQGTFLETARIAASGLGYKADIEYFPQGQYANTELQNRPVARVTLQQSAGISPDPLFGQLLKRSSNKRDYDQVALTAAEQIELQQFNADTSDSTLVFKSSPKDQKQLSDWLTQAMQIEVGNKERDAETIAMFRVNDAEVAKYRDGFGVAQSGMSGIKKTIAETFFLSREKMEKDPTDFGNQAVDMTKSQSESAATFALMITKNNQRIDQVKIGQAYCRMNLQTTAMGLAQHPMSQILQEYKDMLPMQKTFLKHYNIAEGDTVQMLFRLGRAEPVKHSARRAVQSIVQV